MTCLQKNKVKKKFTKQIYSIPMYVVVIILKIMFKSKLSYWSILSKDADILQGQMVSQELPRNLILVQMKLKSLCKL